MDKKDKQQLSEIEIWGLFITSAIKNVSRDFFDLIVIDECHRCSVKDGSA